ncbi:LutC/YkgG family protein [Tepidicaulis sp. LMO-SS28]|uniref:LutC/YkgG family protein n=1 Tax=Tepidicaulis sp. LMO-SS28 TaxID=3447455 RepID=UPI003EE3F196
MNAREMILNKIARTRGARGTTEKPVPLRPALAAQQGGAGLEQFVRLAKSLGCGFSFIERIEETPRAVAEMLSAQDLPRDIWLSDDPALLPLDWKEAGLALHDDRSRDALDGVVSVTGAVAGLAETGAVAVASSANHPFALGLLPDVHVVVLSADRVVAGMEDVWPLIRKAGGNRLPRAVSLVGGPSRTGDIEATLVMGAHGPRALHIVLVGEGASGLS